MRNSVAIAWTAEMDALLGTMPDGKVGERLGLDEERARYRRIRLGIPPFRQSRGPVTIPCATCGTEIERKARDVARSKRLFCSRTCADQAQKKRDTDTLRYGPGWKNVRAKIRARDKVCRSCGMTPEENRAALQVHHLKPFRLGGSNHPTNLVALCQSCHHMIEAVMTSVFDSIPIDVSLAGSSLTIRLDGRVRWSGSVPGAVVRTRTTSAA